jgi:hypothetical protein
MIKFTPFPTIVRYTDNMPDKNAAETRGFYVKVRNNRKDDIGIHHHEYEHVTQWYIITILSFIFMIFVSCFNSDLIYFSTICLSVNSILYKMVPSYRLYAEVFAYKTQAKFDSVDNTEKYARFICDNYGLNINKETAIKLIRN